MARRRRQGENERFEEGVEGEVEIPNPEDNVVTRPVETPILSEPMVEQTSTSGQEPYVRIIGQNQGIGPSTMPTNPWDGLVNAMGQQLMNTMERWATSFLDRMNNHQPTNTRQTEEVVNVPQQRLAREKQPMQVNGHTNGQTSTQNFERPSPQSWYEPISRPIAGQNASVLNNEATQVGGSGQAQETGIRVVTNPMFEAIPGTMGYTNPLFEFTPGGLEGFPTNGRDTIPVPAPFAGPFAGHAQRGYPYPQQQLAPQGQPAPNLPPYGPRGPQAQVYPPNPVFAPPVVVQHAQNMVPRDQIVDIVREICGPMAGGVQTPIYRKPYPEWVDRVHEYPRGFRIPDFTLFYGTGNQSTIEHIARFAAQCSEFTNHDYMKLRLFPNSLTGGAFVWYINLTPGSIQNWQQMEEAFHAQFFQSEPEVSVADLARLSQRIQEQIRKESLKFSAKTEKAMGIDRDPFPEVGKAAANVITSDFQNLSLTELEEVNVKMHVANQTNIKKNTRSPPVIEQGSSHQMECSDEESLDDDSLEAAVMQRMSPVQTQYKWLRLPTDGKQYTGFQTS
ncbi:uncharacterized protein LOC114268949 [Camellia sinensis]|uniref:uncharacterized protein LOC114268949 n=1 Tax=Camellia sinensis TaxID=4442 RepID=UPI001036D676|nr:uncharacterized protein LOC114268949 [Camellia sinensis]